MVLRLVEISLFNIADSIRIYIVIKNSNWYSFILKFSSNKIFSLWKIPHEKLSC